MKLDKYSARVDTAATAISELTTQVKELEAEVNAIDKGQAEATKMRVAEKEDNTKAMKDFKDSADAVIQAIGVLKSFYEGGSFIQLRSRTRRASASFEQPELGESKGDAAS